MGQEITTRHFSADDFVAFKQALQQETDTLARWFKQRLFSSHALVAGYEMEAWLIDAAGRPAARNQDFLEAAANPLYSPELAQFNIEINTHPLTIQRHFLSDFEKDFQQHWLYCKTIAESLGCRVLATGVLQTLQDNDLSMQNISPMLRYQALNEQVLAQRQGRPLLLNINGHESLKSQHQNVMLEAATTSLQVHLQVPQDLAQHYYNAAIVLSAPMVAVSANSPYVFGKDLWAESRIPLFEQSVDIGGYNGAVQGPVHRVSFGSGYARHSLLECFTENLQHFPVLLPMQFDKAPDSMAHVNLHNGTIWRWNRPLVGFDEDGTPHLRIEHRVMPSGPSVLDNIANMAFFYGLVHYYATDSTPPHELMEFARARDNFYTAAQHGLETQVVWRDGARSEMRQLILHQLLEQAEAGLHSLGLDAHEVEDYLGIIEARVDSGKTGSAWQREFMARNHGDMPRLLKAYYHNQQSASPVHRWDYQSYN